IDAGENVNTQNSFFENCLFLAAKNANLPLVLYLLEKGANVKQLNSGHQNVMHAACIGGNLEIVKLLLQAGADPRLATLNPRVPQRPVFWAVKYNHPNIVRYYKEQGLLQEDDIERMFNAFGKEKSNPKNRS